MLRNQKNIYIYTINHGLQQLQHLIYTASSDACFFYVFILKLTLKTLFIIKYVQEFIFKCVNNFFINKTQIN